MDFFLILILCCLPSLLLTFGFLFFLFKNKRAYNKVVSISLEVLCLILFPLVYLIYFDGEFNDCCRNTAAFSPSHRLTLYVILLLVLFGYFISRHKANILSPVVEVLLNSILIIGFAFNCFIGFHVEEYFWFIGNVPIAILLIFQLIENHRSILDFFENDSFIPSNFFEKIAMDILTSKTLIKFPILIILCLPILIIITSILLIFGQKPDSAIRVFSDTYKHGFSQLDYLCDNVQCGGHFLCSVAAKGHINIVKPIRYGERKGNKIICNRQLLIANAFEEIVEQKLPKIHKIIRHRYNKIGALIHKHYYLFENKYISDLIYISMKPLELFFLAIIYTVDTKPENRIARQYSYNK